MMASGRDIILDLSRLLIRARHPTPTGIDRVEMAYAEYLIGHELRRVHFAAIHPLGHLALLPKEAALAFVESLGDRWRGSDGSSARLFMLGQRLLHSTLVRWSAPGPRTGWREQPVYLNVSHHGLNRPRAIEDARRSGVKFVCLVHDLIPIQLPEYVRPMAAEKHRRRIDTVARLSDGIIVGSATTHGLLMPYLQKAGRSPPVVVAHLGADPCRHRPDLLPHGADRRPYFVCLGTIEPRKNHLLLLNIWRRLAAEFGDSAPRLVLVGRRGWENENIVDMIDRCSVPSGLVEERCDISDGDVRHLLSGAAALLFPSFAEGYGLPLVEALALGVPVLCSDLAVLRELGGSVPEYLDPLDGMGWMQAILHYARAASPRRSAQLAKLADWQPPRWDDHVRNALGLIDDLADTREAA